MIMVNAITKQNQKYTTTTSTRRDKATLVEFHDGWKGVVSCATTISNFDDDDDNSSSSTMGEEGDYSVYSMMSQSPSPESQSKNYSHNSKNHTLECINLLIQVAQRQSFTLEERKEVGEMAERVTHYHQQLKLAININKYDDNEKEEEIKSASTCMMTTTTIIGSTDDDNGDKSRMNVYNHIATKYDDMLFDQLGNRGNCYGFEAILPEYAFVTTTTKGDDYDNEDETSTTNKEQMVVAQFESNYNNICIDHSFERETKKKNSGNHTNNTDHIHTADTDTCTTATEMDVDDLLSKYEDEISYFECVLLEDEEKEIYFTNEDDEDDDDVIIQGVQKNDDVHYDNINDTNANGSNDNSKLMIDNLIIDPLELELFELKNDIAIHLDSFEAIREWQHPHHHPQQHKHQQQQKYHPQYQQYQEYNYPPCKRIPTIEECDGILPPTQYLRTIDNQKSNNNNHHNEVVVAALPINVNINTTDDDIDTSTSTSITHTNTQTQTQIIIPFNDDSAFNKYLSYSKFFVHQKWGIIV